MSELRDDIKVREKYYGKLGIHQEKGNLEISENYENDEYSINFFTPKTHH